MGGHGGLNILPQKRWNVYNFDNRERVRKDEEKAAQQEQKAQRIARQRDTEFRLEKLREISHAKRLSGAGGAELGSDAGQGDGKANRVSADSPKVVKIEHINLFKDVQERPLEGNSGHADRKRKGEDGRIKEGKARQDPVDASDEPYRFAYGSVGKNTKRPWYLTKSFVLNRGEDDPRALNEGESAAESSRSDKKRRKSVEELRADRLRREDEERIKARKVLVAQASASATFQHRQSKQSNGYYQSYGNAR